MFIKENQSKAKEKDIRIKKDFSSNLRVLGGNLLKELFNNLIKNSIKHSGANEIKISAEEKQRKVICSVIDDGKGIPEEKKQKVFEKGYKHGESGETGLGLYLVKKIAENYDGEVKVKDSEMNGTAFDVVLNKPN